MALSIKSDRADHLARELVARTGETLTEAVVVALSERLARLSDPAGVTMAARLGRLASDVASLAVADPRSPEEIIDYDRTGAPR